LPTDFDHFDLSAYDGVSARVGDVAVDFGDGNGLSPGARRQDSDY
jgi:hypothetical protein